MNEKQCFKTTFDSGAVWLNVDYVQCNLQWEEFREVANKQFELLLMLFYNISIDIVIVIVIVVINYWWPTNNLSYQKLILIVTPVHDIVYPIPSHMWIWLQESRYHS